MKRNLTYTRIILLQVVLILYCCTTINAQQFNKIDKKTQRNNQYISNYPIDAAIVNLLNIEKYQY